jgi:predicted O-methyltransferase YrrM
MTGFASSIAIACRTPISDKAPMPPANSKQRFSNRVADYVRYRPGYPAQILPLLESHIGLTSAWSIADIGSGTGLSAKLFLDHGNVVFGVEPNAEMRAAAEAFLAEYPAFKSIDGSAEQTNLAETSIDLIVASQAFHWFDRKKCRTEFARILKPNGYCLVMWNVRKTKGTPFLEAYESLLLKYGTDYGDVRHENIDAPILRRFFQDGYQEARFPNQQRFDLDGVIGRCNSSSYAPAQGQPNHQPLMRGLREIFARYQTNGFVSFEYETELYWGQFNS